jgi:hypothetical protein
VRQHVGFLIPHDDPFFNSHRSALIALAARHACPQSMKRAILSLPEV